MLQALEHYGLTWRIAYTANSLADMKAAVRANLGITALIEVSDHFGLKPVFGLPELPEAAVIVHHSPGTPPPAVRDFMQTTRELFHSPQNS
jgi:DNA-binding transcriptional LysR family regulator